MFYILGHLADTLEVFTLQQAGPNYCAQFYPLYILNRKYIADRIVIYILEHLVDTLDVFTVQQAGPNYCAQFCPLCILNRKIFNSSSTCTRRIREEVV